MRYLTPILMGLFVGCTGNLVDIAPGSGNGNKGGGADLASPGGGGSMDFGTLKFSTDINPDLDSIGCTGGGCHGGSATPKLTMGAAAANYSAIITLVDKANPANSQLLTLFLQGSGSHPGGTFFSTTDATYQKWLAWIKGGALQ
jgi:hypothetical protein